MQLIALFIVLAVLFLICIIPLGVSADYDKDGLKLFLKVAFFSISADFSKKKPKEEKLGKDKKKKKKFNLGFGLAEWLETVKLALRTLGSFGKRLYFERLRLLYVCSTDDPYTTATRYNTVSAALHTLVPLFEKKFTVKNKDIIINTDFDSDKSVIEFGFTASVRVGWLLIIAFTAAFAFAKIYFRSRKKAKNERMASHG